MGESLADHCREQQRSRRTDVEAAILLLCISGYRTAAWLANRLAKGQETISNHYLRKMVKQGWLAYSNPANPTDPEQAYITTSAGGIRMVDERLGGGK